MPEAPPTTTGVEDAPLACARDDFHLEGDVHYLNCAYLAPLLKRVEEAGIDGIRRRRRPQDVHPESFFSEADRARQVFGTLIGAPRERIALIPSVSYGMATVAANLAVERGQTIVIPAEQFPSNVYAWRALAARSGAEVRTVKPPAPGPRRGELWNEALLGAIGPETAAVAAGNVHWADGTRFDLEAIGERARGVGAALIVDGTQSVGALPFDVERIRPDAVVCAAYKWLLGPYSQGVAYLGPRFDGGRPLEETWLGRQGSEDFTTLTRYRDEYQPGAARFDMGERSNFVLLPMMIAAVEQLLEWRPERIQAYCRELNGPLVEEAGYLGYFVEDAAWRGEHMFGLRLPPHVRMGSLRKALDRRGIVVSLRGDAVRISLHLHNDPGDVAALIEALAEVA